uniref:Cilia-and flagella-associated protein 96 n=1 Tax=Geotrypetes seraphini TaxID=260995 RepID=A0A6P8REU0_GEOSA|nr:UPF0602 protein C4orf47 homolog isoform X3 [Geotrypetes seraphini]
MGAEGKTDMERLGLFSEMEYVTIGDSYIPSLNRPFNDAAGKGRQMFPGGSKLMSDLQAGYFDAQFKRVFTGEGYSNPIKLRRLYRLDQSKRNLGKSFLPSSVSKKSSGLGSYYGTIGGSVQAFSSQLKTKAPYVAPGKNFYTNPGKKGTGYGYPNLTIGKPFAYSAEIYDKGPRKKMGGMKAGTFDPYPTHSTDPYKTKYEKEVAVNKSGKIFHPLAGTKTRPVRSVLQAYVLKSVNTKNYKTLNLESY